MIFVLGWLGFLLTVTAYAGVVTRRLKPETKRYGYLNLVAAVFCGLTAADAGVWSIVALNVVWGIIASCGLLHRGNRSGRDNYPDSSSRLRR
jgi:hypothetical protein